MTAAEYRIIREQARSRIAASQRFDRDAVKAMLADAIHSSVPSWVRVHGAEDDPANLTYVASIVLQAAIDEDRLADMVLRWFGGKWAA